MKQIGLLIIILLGAYLLNSCVSKEGRKGLSQVVNITPQELKEKIGRKENFILLDVREKDEYASGNIADSILIPLGELERRSNELDKSKEIVVYCRSGRRSLIGANKLIQLGFPKVTNVTGGFLEWQQINK